MIAELDQIQEWAEKLTEAQAKELVATLVAHGIETTDIRFWRDDAAPYWDSCGDPLVEGQEIVKED